MLFKGEIPFSEYVWLTPARVSQEPLNRWMSQLDLGNMTGGLETVVSVHK